MNLPLVRTVPHASLKLCENRIREVLAPLSCTNPSDILVLAPLHLGKPDFEGPFRIYSYSSCKIDHPLIEKNDCVCSEEYSFDIIKPLLDEYFPDADKTAFFAPCDDAEIAGFIDFLVRLKPESIFLISSNQDCASMWSSNFPTL